MSALSIQTLYKGYRFRSRLEARWAVFMDSLGVHWEYEKEGFNVGDGARYLPDFWIAEPHYNGGNGFWVEVKPEMPSEAELWRLQRVCALTVRHGYFLIGTPGDVVPKPVLACQVMDLDQFRAAPCTDRDFLVWEYIRMFEGPLQRIKKAGVNLGSRTPVEHMDAITDAFFEARSARFEFGDTPR